MTNQTPNTFLLRGGLDIETPAIAVKPGRLIGGYNYESVAGGYRRRSGYERHDGRPAPSAASYWVLAFDAGVTAVTAGQTVTGATSGATGVAVVAGVLESGTYGAGTAVGYLVLRVVVGTFQNNENLQVSAATVAVANGTATQRGAATDENDAAWLLASATAARALIAKPAGSGPVRGVAALNGSLYCVRNNAGGTEGVLYKATSSGWTAQSLGHILEFTAGQNTVANTAGFVEGETITKGGATAVVRRVAVLSGDYDTNDAAGFLIVASIAGTFTAGTITGPSGQATIAAAPVAQTLPPGGRYRFDTHNFRGAAGSKRLYGANGVGRAFEWDGTTFAPLRTGLSDALDKPTHVAEFAEHLFLFYAAGSGLHSEIGEPLQWTTTSGAGEIAFGDVPTDVLESTTVLMIGCATSMHYLTGTSAANFARQTVSADSGCLAHTAQQIDTAYYFDGGSIRKLTQTEALGGFRMGGVAAEIEKLWKNKVVIGATPVTSWRIRARDHYTILMSDRTGVTLFLGRREPEATVVEFPFLAHCSYAGDEMGYEAVFVGDSEGWVYRLDSGRDDDGAALSALAILGYLTVGGVKRNQRWHRAEVELESAGAASLSIAYEGDYGDPESAPGVETAVTVPAAGGRWNLANWNQFAWSSSSVGKGSARVDIVGRNLGVALLSEATFEEAHTLGSLTLWTTPRKVSRR